MQSTRFVRLPSVLCTSHTAIFRQLPTLDGFVLASKKFKTWNKRQTFINSRQFLIDSDLLKNAKKLTNEFRTLPIICLLQR